MWKAEQAWNPREHLRYTHICTPGSHYIALAGLLTHSLPLPLHAGIKGHYAQN